MRGFSDDLGHVDPSTINDIKSALSKVKLPQEITVFRGTDSMPFQSIAELDEMGKIDWNSLVGKTFTDNAFLSTSVEKGSSFGHLDVLWEIKLPKGSNGGMINQISKYPNEMEFLLNSGSEFKIVGTQIDKLGKTKILLELIN